MYISDAIISIILIEEIYSYQLYSNILILKNQEKWCYRVNPLRYLFNIYIIKILTEHKMEMIERL